MLFLIVLGICIFMMFNNNSLSLCENDEYELNLTIWYKINFNLENIVLINKLEIIVIGLYIV